MRGAPAGLALALLAGCGGSPAPTTPVPQPALEAAREIMRLEEAWGRALSTRDTAFFRETLADDFVGTGGTELRSKRTVIEELSRSLGAVPVPRLEQTQVRLFGDVAVVTGVAVYQATDGMAESRTRYTEVWVKRAGRWQAVHGHYNAIPLRGS